MTVKEKHIIQTAVYKYMQENIRMTESWSNQQSVEVAGQEAALTMVDIARQELADTAALYRKIVSDETFLQ